ncbi:MAG: hypothetical protein ACI8W7_003308, partial [Gammaproteobacteria bacterium]
GQSVAPRMNRHIDVGQSKADVVVPPPLKYLQHVLTIAFTALSMADELVAQGLGLQAVFTTMS